MSDTTKYYEYLDELRFKGETLSYVLREKLMQKFGMPTRRATELLEAYNRELPNRKQFLTES